MGSMFIGGKWVAAASGETIPVLSPVDGQAFGAIARGRDVDVDAAVRAAERALSGAWGKMTATERGRILSRLAQKIADNAEDLAHRVEMCLTSRATMAVPMATFAAALRARSWDDMAADLVAAASAAT